MPTSQEGAEKTQLLKSLVEAKFTASITELLTQVRLWRRWLGRAEELGLSLPDPIVLMVAVQRTIDAATKIGGPQLSFRLANARQELKVDHAATLPSVRELAEYVQAEIEDMSLTMVVKPTGAAQVSVPTPQPASSGEGRMMIELERNRRASFGRVRMDAEEELHVPMLTTHRK